MCENEIGFSNCLFFHVHVLTICTSCLSWQYHRSETIVFTFQPTFVKYRPSMELVNLSPDASELNKWNRTNGAYNVSFILKLLTRGTTLLICLDFRQFFVKFHHFWSRNGVWSRFCDSEKLINIFSFFLIMEFSNLNIICFPLRTYIVF